MREAPEK